MKTTLQSLQVFLKILPAKLLPKNQLIDLCGVEGEITVVPIERKAKRQEISQVLGRYVTTDGLRPAMNGVFHDAERQCKVVTDGRYLLVLPDAITGESKIISPKGDVIDERFPAYTQVIPVHSHAMEFKNINRLRATLNGLCRATRFVSGLISAVVKTQYGFTHFDPTVLLVAIEALLDTGSTRLMLEMRPEGQSEKTIVIRDFYYPSKFVVVSPLVSVAVVCVVIEGELSKRKGRAYALHLERELANTEKHKSGLYDFYKKQCEEDPDDLYYRDKFAKADFEYQQILAGLKEAIQEAYAAEELVTV